MRQTYHLCLSSHDEVMYRDEEDLIMGFNSLALAVFSTESRLLAEAFMPTHNHKAIQSDFPKELVKRERYTFTRYFNAKYHRLGRLGEKHPFQLTVNGIHHTLTMLNYIIRQGLHHGLATTPFDYKHCSANCYFRNDLGRTMEEKLILDELQYKYLPEHNKLPPGYRMNSNGLILRTDVVDSKYVEEIYITPRNFLFQMNKLTDEKVIQIQMEENNTQPVTLDLIERGVKEYDYRKSLVFEQGRVNNSMLTDLELCRLIDTVILPRYLKDNKAQSIYVLPKAKRAEIGNTLWLESRNSFGLQGNGILNKKKTTADQIRRCLALNNSTD